MIICDKCYPIRIFYASSILGILQQNKELSSIHFIKDPNFESKNWIIKTKKCENLKVFSNFNIRQLETKKWHQYEFFYTSSMLGILHHTKEISSCTNHQIL